MNGFTIFLLIILVLLLFWLFGLKFVLKYMKKDSAPCPSSMSWIVDFPIRKRYMQPVLDRAGLQPARLCLSLAPAPVLFLLMQQDYLEKTAS